MEKDMDWGKHKVGEGVECTFTPRTAYKGRPMLQGMEEHAGQTVRLIALWQMDDNDPYPGEWALGAADRRSEIFGRMWIASGDVTPNVELTGGQNDAKRRFGRPC